MWRYKTMKLGGDTDGRKDGIYSYTYISITFFFTKHKGTCARETRKDGRTYGWSDGWTKGRMDGWKHGWMDGRIDVVTLKVASQTLMPTCG